MPRALRKQVMHSLWVRILVAMAGWIGLSAAASAQTVRSSLGVSATVVRSCTFSTGQVAQVACPDGTGWTRTMLSEGQQTGGHAEATKGVQPASPADRALPRILFVTTSF